MFFAGLFGLVLGTYMVLGNKQTRCLYHPAHQPVKHYILNVFAPRDLPSNAITYSLSADNQTVTDNHVNGVLLKTFQLDKNSRKSVCLTSAHDKPVKIYFSFQGHDFVKAQVRQYSSTEVLLDDKNLLPSIFSSLAETLSFVQNTFGIVGDKSARERQFQRREQSVSSFLLLGMLAEVVLLAVLSVVQYSKIKSVLSSKCLI